MISDPYVLPIYDYEMYKEGIITKGLSEVFRDIKRRLPDELKKTVEDYGFGLTEIEDDAMAKHLLIEVKSYEPTLVALSNKYIFSIVCLKN